MTAVYQVNETSGPGAALNEAGIRAKCLTLSHGPHYNAAMTDRPALQPVDYARMAVDVASEGQASDIVMLDISGCSDFTDYFVILSVESSRQMRSIVDELEGTLERAGARLHHREGSPQGGWRLLDFGDVIIHVFGVEERDYYRIEGAWPEAAEVVRIQ